MGALSTQKAGGVSQLWAKGSRLGRERLNDEMTYTN